MNDLIQSVKENISFICVILLVFVAFLAVAWLFERFVMKERRKLSSAQYIATLAMCAALGAVLMLLEFPVFFAPPFYGMDFSEVPMLFASFYLGPVGGVIAELLKNIVKLFLKGTSTAFVGEFANFTVSCFMVLPASIIYHINKRKKSAIIGLATGTVSMAAFGSAFNAIYLLPKFAQLYGMPLDTIIGMGTDINGSITNITTFVIFCVAPLNLVKGTIVSILTMLLYKHVARPLFGSTK